MKVSELSIDKIVTGLRVKGLKTGVLGTIVRIDYDDDRYAWIQWDNDDRPYSGFYGNDCECEIIESSI